MIVEWIFHFLQTPLGWFVTLVIVAAVILIAKSIVIVGGSEVATLERRYFGRPMPQGRVIAQNNEVGTQARTLGPGLHFLIPFLYKAAKQPFSSIRESEVGLLESIDGNPVAPGRIFARVVEGHASFQNGEAFLSNGGEKGPQIQILPPGTYRINPILFRIKKVPVISIDEAEVGILVASDGQPIPPGKIFAKVIEGHNAFQDGEAFLRNGGEKGPQIEVLPPGTYRINTDLFLVRKVSVVVIEQGKIGLITSMDGESIPAGRLLARKVDGHSSFENGQNFLKNGGQKGPQIEVLLPGTYRINTDLFHIEIRPATVIPAGKVGLVTSLDGEPLPEAEYVAKSISGHNDYQDASQFLVSGGQRGPQFDVLKPGTYYINPLNFNVDLDDVAIIERGQVGVVVSNVGEEPSLIVQKAKAMTDENSVDDANLDPEERLKKGLERYVVPKGYRGVQQEVAGPGFYYLNRRAYMAYVVNTTNITIDWDDSSETRFNPLKVISRDGFEISVSVKVVIRVRPDQAPYMVAKIGSVENLILHVIHPMIDSSFRNQASSTSAMNFMQDRQEEQRKAEERARNELEKYHVECVSVLICQINLPQDLMDTQTRKIIAQQQQAMYQDQQKAEQTRIATEKTRAQADQQKNLVEAEIGVQIAEQNRAKAIQVAQGEAESIRLKAEGEAKGIRALGEAEGAKILAIGESTAKSYELQNGAVGAQGVTAIEIAKQIASGQIKITPDFLVQGGDNVGGLLSAFLTQIISNKSTVLTPNNTPDPVKENT